jgi:hypothetical protein
MTTLSATANSSRTQVSYVIEPAFGAPGADPTLVALRCTSESFVSGRTTTATQELRADRQVPDDVTTGEQPTGDLGIEFQYAEYDPLLEAVLQGTWSTGVLTNGTTERSITFEVKRDDTLQYKVIKGAVANQFSLKAASKEMFTGSFSFMGQSFTRDTSSISTTSPTASTTNRPYNGVSDISGVKFGGVAYTAGVKNFEFTVGNNARMQDQIGSVEAVGFGFGNIDVNGKFTAYFKDANAIITAYNSDSYTSFEFTVGTAGAGYKFQFPRIHIMKADDATGGINQDVVLDVEWKALRDPVTGVTVKITKI